MMTSEQFRTAMAKLFPEIPEGGPLPEDGFGRTEFTYAILRHQPQRALELLAQYRCLDHLDHAGCSDLYFAAREGELQVVEALLRCGADPELSTATGFTPLIAALEHVQWSHDPDACDRALTIVKLLLEAGADPDRKNRSGGTPRQLSKYLAPGPIAQYLQALPPRNESGG